MSVLLSSTWLNYQTVKADFKDSNIYARERISISRPLSTHSSSTMTFDKSSHYRLCFVKYKTVTKYYICLECVNIGFDFINFVL